MRIAVDVLGGDHAPGEILKGVADALKSDFTADQFLLAGPPEVIEAGLRSHGIVDIPAILATDQVVESHEKPTKALKSKPRSTIALCVGAVKQGHAGGLISFGNTGAAVAAATFGLGMLPGMKRPGISVVLTGSAGKIVLLDAGANPQAKALHLFQYAVAGSAFAHDMHGIANPRVGLLNIGGEAGKGSPAVQEVHAMLEQSSLTFVGNVEGQELFAGVADVLVTDGFVGNMILKVVEGFVEYVVRESQAEKSAELRQTFRRLFGAADFADIGGATLLGVDGVVLIGHGRSHANAVAPALRAVRGDIEAGVNRHIIEAIGAEAPDSASQEAERD
ncbi:MAG: phosphate acyltransferase PlsX [Planctomycetes bacterium]|nr:phosphate acyltransferase PlsX [Planctomycetota bacterium]MBL7007570.1 phosphate acyltransferase PlsX [Planctomycetota bacterium]